MLEKPAITAVDINEVVAHRWSPRAFKADAYLSQTQIIALLEAARWAPSCYGDEPWRFIVCDKQTMPEAWEKALSCLAEANQIWAKNAPLFLLVFANPHFKRDGKPNRWAEYDTGAATENLCLQAVTMGLVAHPMGGFEVGQVQKHFNVPEHIIGMTIIAIGYQASPDSLTEGYQTLEVQERERTPLNEHCFAGIWGKPLPDLP